MDNFILNQMQIRVDGTTPNISEGISPVIFWNIYPQAKSFSQDIFKYCVEGVLESFKYSTYLETRPFESVK